MVVWALGYPKIQFDSVTLQATTKQLGTPICVSTAPVLAYQELPILGQSDRRSPGNLTNLYDSHAFHHDNRLFEGQGHFMRTII